MFKTFLHTMKSAMALLGCVSALVAGAMAAASYPVIPSDRTTPTQQRISIKGPNCELETVDKFPLKFGYADLGSCDII